MLKTLITNALQSPISTITGLVSLASLLAPIWLPPDWAHKVQESALILASSSLLAVKDPTK